MSESFLVAISYMMKDPRHLRYKERLPRHWNHARAFHRLFLTSKTVASHISECVEYNIIEYGRFSIMMYCIDRHTGAIWPDGPSFAHTCQSCQAAYCRCPGNFCGPRRVDGSLKVWPALAAYCRRPSRPSLLHWY